MSYKLLKTKPDISDKCQLETWNLNHNKQNLFNVDVKVFYNKKFNILKLKNNNHEDFNDKVDEISSSRKKLFEGKKDHINHCPICKSKSIKKIYFQIYNGKYVECVNCSHNYVTNRLKEEELIDFYKNSKAYQSTYTNQEQIERRIKEIYEPKLDWVLKIFKTKYGTKPRKILDVGTGSGHFVKLCHDRGIQCDGIEVSKSGLDFAKNNFNIKLHDKDIFNEWKFFSNKNYDIITCWGLIEHVTNPLELLKISSKILGKNEGMIVGSVPRLDSLSSFIQRQFPNNVIRHLDPLGHIQMFTDLSLSTMVHNSNFKLNSVWYFGMDAYEFLIQLASYSKNNVVINGDIINSLQLLMDLNTLSDSMIFSATNKIK